MRMIAPRHRRRGLRDRDTATRDAATRAAGRTRANARDRDARGDRESASTRARDGDARRGFSERIEKMPSGAVDVVEGALERVQRACGTKKHADYRRCDRCGASDDAGWDV